MADAVPFVLAGDERFRALAALSARLNHLDMTRLLVNLIDTVSAEALSWLAEQFHVMGDEGWNAAHDDAARRALIKSAIELHRYKGTPWAVRQALATIGLERVKLVENWQVSPRRPAYTFRALFPPEPALQDAGQVRRIRGLIDEYKNLRSHYDVAISLNPTKPDEPVDAPADIPGQTGIRHLGIWHLPRHLPRFLANFQPGIGMAGVSIARLGPSTSPFVSSATTSQHMAATMVARLGPGWPTQGWRQWQAPRTPSLRTFAGWRSQGVLVLRPQGTPPQATLRCGLSAVARPVARPWPASPYAWRNWQRPNAAQENISEFALGLAQGYSQTSGVIWTRPGEGTSWDLLANIQSGFGE